MAAQPKILEIACFSNRAASLAGFYGAGRIELCKQYSAGGLTPDLVDFTKVVEEVSIPVFVMIRPRGGDFTYSHHEISKMTDSIKLFSDLGAKGFVFAVLNEKQELDVRLCQILVQSAGFLPCTLNRAFDQIEDKEEAVKQAIDCGFERILTAGGNGNCSDNIKIMAKLAKIANGNITIIAGGGLRSNNIRKICQVEGIHEFHSSAIVNRVSELPDPGEIDKMTMIISGT